MPKEWATWCPARNGCGSRPYWKYTLISRIRWVGSLENAVTAPLIPAGTIAAFDATDPPEFSVETTGMVPFPHNVRKPKPPVGTTVAFSEYTFVVAGTPHDEDGTLKLRVSLWPMIGPPNGPAALR